MPPSIPATNQRDFLVFQYLMTKSDHTTPRSVDEIQKGMEIPPKQRIVDSVREIDTPSNRPALARIHGVWFIIWSTPFSLLFQNRQISKP